MIEYRKGNAAYPDVANAAIIHVCNNLGLWGRGFTASLSQRSRDPEQVYRHWVRAAQQQGASSQLLLGLIRPTMIPDSDVTGIHMIAQDGVRSANEPKPLVPEALEQCLFRAADLVRRSNLQACMPRIGSGLAGGDWDNEIVPMIERAFGDQRVIVYDLQ